MNQTDIIKHYFSLFDHFRSKTDDFRPMLDLFNDQASIITPDGQKIIGKQAIEQFFVQFFTHNHRVTHNYQIQNHSSYSAVWSATVTTESRYNVESKGIDYYEFDEEGKIRQLKLVVHSSK